MSTKPLLISMREFRAAPAKVLRRAVRTATSIQVGEFVLQVSEPASGEERGIVGALRSDLDPGSPDDWLSAEEAWDTDG